MLNSQAIAWPFSRLLNISYIISISILILPAIKSLFSSVSQCYTYHTKGLIDACIHYLCYHCHGALLLRPINPHSVYHTGRMMLHSSLCRLYCSPLVQPLHSLFTSPSAMPYQTTKGESFHSLVAKDDVFYSCSLPVVIFLFQAQPYHTIPYHTKSFSCCPSSCHQCHCPLV